MSDAARLLELLRDAAGRHEDLAAALRNSGLPGAATAAGRLEAGATLTAALDGLLPPRLAGLLGGGLPPLATVAALLADEAWRAHERRRCLVRHLAYPLASLALLGLAAAALAVLLPPGPGYAPMTTSAWALPPLALALLMVAAPWAPRTWRLPGSGWARHLDQAGRWARAGLALRWRLTEDQALRLLGADLAPCTAVLGTPGGAVHCRMLADWHRRAARRRLALTARIAAALLLAGGGGLVLGSVRLWQGCG